MNRWKGILSCVMAIMLVMTSAAIAPHEAKAEGESLASDFEDNTLQGWSGRASTVKLSVAEGIANSGTRSLLVAGRTSGWHGPQLSLSSYMQTGQNYALSAWVRLPAETTDAPVSMLIQRTTDGTNHYEPVATKTVNANGWVKLEGEYKLTQASENVMVYLESFDNPELSFYVDDFLIEPAAEPEPIVIEEDIPNLKDVYKDQFLLGSSLLVNEIADPDGPDADLLKKHFNSLTPGNELKWDATEPVEGQFNFTRADRIVDFAVENGIPVRGHTLIWHSQTPNWVFYDENGELVSKEVLFERMKNHIDEVMGRYKGKIYAWDVVNEVIEVGDKQPNGLRNSPWYQIAGEEYIEKAFEYAHAADPAAVLYINDYNTHIADKRQALYDLIKRLQAKGIPVEGVGHQTHIGIEYPAVQELDDMIGAFRDLGIEQQVTEMDMSVYTNDSQSYETFSEELQLQQAYRYQAIFDVFKKHADQLTAVIFWGKDDANTWLRTFPVARNNWPLLFDERLQAKLAYWAIVDPTKLPVQMKDAMGRQGSVVIDGVQEQAWNRTPSVQVSKAGIEKFSFRTLWEENRLNVLVHVSDSTIQAGDKVEIFVDGNNGKTEVYEADDFKYSFSRSGTSAPAGTVLKTAEKVTGYLMEASIPLEGAAIGREIGFDVRIVDGADDSPALQSWNDTTNEQDSDTSKFGVLTLAEGALATEAMRGTPVIDGEKDAAWQPAGEIATDRFVIGESGASAKVRTLWDDERLYVWAEVTDPLLFKESANAHEQDSIEIFVDQNNAATTIYQADDGQYRINFDNEPSTNPGSKSSKLTSATKLTATGYIVEASILLDAVQPAAGGAIGFDVQVNDDRDGDGTRDSVSIWNDRSGLSWQNTSGYGVLTFAEEEDEPGTGNPYVPPVVPTVPSAVLTDAEFADALEEAVGGKLTIEAEASNAGSVTLELTGKQLQQAEEAGIKVIVIRTELAVLQLPISLMQTSASGNTAKLSVRKVDSAKLPQSVRDEIGDNAVLDFTLTVDGKNVTSFGNGQSVRVSMPYDLKPGEKPGQVVVYYIAEDGKLETIKNAHYNPSTGRVAFKTTHFSQFAAAENDITFSDLNKAAWARDAIEALAARGIVQGVSEASFAPNAEVTREQFIHLLVQTLELEAEGEGGSFTDVASGSYYEASVAAAAELGIVKGMPDGRFGVGEAISREDMAIMVYNAIGETGVSLPGNVDDRTFGDEAAIAEYARKAVAGLASAGIVNGKPGNVFDPAGVTTRAEAAVLLYRLLELGLTQD
ncbi:endo-1,4-beta-xylanase [Paenibacillus sp. SCIV0701]|uniref:Beta-xylanase n=2 Tax=Paenibacillus soyae TaxID=2969249 RepID=A0A9X2MVV7_9BACL|nr:endo-1,4-beta-xylanase [Paenibacillus soyae]